jgi:hypothetical protein
MAENKAFWSAFIGGMTSTASLFPSGNRYTAYVARTPVDQQFAAVGFNIARELREYESGPAPQPAKLPKRANST